MYYLDNIMQLDLQKGSYSIPTLAIGILPSNLLSIAHTHKLLMDAENFRVDIALN